MLGSVWSWGGKGRQEGRVWLRIRTKGCAIPGATCVWGVRLHPRIYVWGLWGVWECKGRVRKRKHRGRRDDDASLCLPSSSFAASIPRISTQQGYRFYNRIALLRHFMRIRCDMLRYNNATCAWHLCPAFFFLHFIIYLPPCTLLPSRFQRTFPHFLHTIAQAGVVSFYARVFKEHMRDKISPESGHVSQRNQPPREKSSAGVRTHMEEEGPKLEKDKYDSTFLG